MSGVDAIREKLLALAKECERKPAPLPPRPDCDVMSALADLRERCGEYFTLSVQFRCTQGQFETEWSYWDIVTKTRTEAPTLYALMTLLNSKSDVSGAVLALDPGAVTPELPQVVGRVSRGAVAPPADTLPEPPAGAPDMPPEALPVVDIREAVAKKKPFDEIPF